MAQPVKNPPAMWETWVRSLGWEDPLEKGKATHSSILACKVHGVAELDMTELLSLSGMDSLGGQRSGWAWSFSHQGGEEPGDERGRLRWGPPASEGLWIGAPKRQGYRPGARKGACGVSWPPITSQLLAGPLPSSLLLRGSSSSLMKTPEGRAESSGEQGVGGAAQGLGGGLGPSPPLWALPATPI